MSETVTACQDNEHWSWAFGRWLLTRPDLKHHDPIDQLEEFLRACPEYDDPPKDPSPQLTHRDCLEAEL